VATRRIAVVTGSRAEYGLLRSTIAAIQSRRELSLQLYVTGMHLVPRFGHTIEDIVADGVPITARVPMQRGSDAATDTAMGLSRGIAGLARQFTRHQPDLVLVLGDRIEALAGALAAVTTGRFVGHIHGGDVATGDLDDSIRHSITKLAHMHFAATADSARRLRRLGEREDAIHLVGAPGLDELRPLVRAATRPIGPRAAGLAARPQGPSSARPDTASPAALVVQHPIGRSATQEYRVARELLAGVREAGLARWIIGPSGDRGSTGILRAIAAHRRESGPGEVRVWPSLPRGEFLRAMLAARVLVGNSSCGVLEAPFLGVPSVNVGPRQQGRLCGGPSVIHAAESLEGLSRAMSRALATPRVAHTRGPYGDGRAGRRIAAILAVAMLDPSMRRKQICY